MTPHHLRRSVRPVWRRVFSCAWGNGRRCETVGVVVFVANFLGKFLTAFTSDHPKMVGRLYRESSPFDISCMVNHHWKKTLWGICFPISWSKSKFLKFRPKGICTRSGCFGRIFVGPGVDVLLIKRFRRFGVDPAKGPSKRTSPSTALPGFGPLGRWSRHTQHSTCAAKGQGLPRGRDVLAEARRSLGRILADASKTLGFNLGCQWLVTTGWHGIPNSRFICYWNPGPPSWFPRCLLFLTEIDLTIAQLLKWVDQPPSIRIQKIMLGKVMIFHVTEIFWFKNPGLSSRSRGCKGSDFCRWD